MTKKTINPVSWHMHTNNFLDPFGGGIRRATGGYLWDCIKADITYVCCGNVTMQHALIVPFFILCEIFFSAIYSFFKLTNLQQFHHQPPASCSVPNPSWRRPTRSPWPGGWGPGASPPRPPVCIPPSQGQRPGIIIISIITKESPEDLDYVGVAWALANSPSSLES